MFSPEGPTLVELAQQALSSTERGYDRLAPKFDHTPFRTPDAIVDGVLELIEEPVQDGLDLCCGTGAALPSLAKRCQRVVGVDFSEGMLEVARQHVEGLPVELRQSDIFSLDDEEAYDVVTCFGAFGHVRPHQEEAFAALIQRVLRPGGRFLFATQAMPPWHSSAFLLSKAFNAAMHLRNALVRPPFVMFYLTFMWPACARLLERHGFDVVAHPSRLPAPWQSALVVSATKR